MQETLFILKQARWFGTEAGDVYQVTNASPSLAGSLHVHLHAVTCVPLSFERPHEDVLGDLLSLCRPMQPLWHFQQLLLMQCR